MSALVHTTVHLHTYVLVTHKYLAHGYHYYSHLHNNAPLEDCCGFTLKSVTTDMKVLATARGKFFFLGPAPLICV